MTPPVLTELRIAPFHYPAATSYTQAYTPFPPIPLRLGDPFTARPPFWALLHSQILACRACRKHVLPTETPSVSSAVSSVLRLQLKLRPSHTCNCGVPVPNPAPPSPS